MMLWESGLTQLRLWYLAEGMCGKIPQFKINSGSEADMEYVLEMRDNLVHYVHLIDIYAPCIVGHTHWNNKSIMLQYCGEGDALFNEFILSISDEAFLLLVLFNYTATWTSELQCEQAKVSHNGGGYILCFLYCCF